jgi:hypothetical protein
MMRKNPMGSMEDRSEWWMQKDWYIVKNEDRTGIIN